MRTLCVPYMVLIQYGILMEMQEIQAGNQGLESFDDIPEEDDMVVIE